jgi:hypothetical protein
VVGVFQVDLKRTGNQSAASGLAAKPLKKLSEVMLFQSQLKCCNSDRCLKASFLEV